MFCKQNKRFYSVIRTISRHALKFLAAPTFVYSVKLYVDIYRIAALYKEKPIGEFSLLVTDVMEAIKWQNIHL